MRTDVTDFTVEGRGEFPFDMLRYSECYPVDGVTVSMLATAGRDTHRRQMKFRTATSMNVHARRWDSFGWKVVKADSERYGDLTPELMG